MRGDARDPRSYSDDSRRNKIAACSRLQLATSSGSRLVQVLFLESGLVQNPVRVQSILIFGTHFQHFTPDFKELLRYYLYFY